MIDARFAFFLWLFCRCRGAAGVGSSSRCFNALMRLFSAMACRTVDRRSISASRFFRTSAKSEKARSPSVADIASTGFRVILRSLNDLDLFLRERRDCAVQLGLQRSDFCDLRRCRLSYCPDISVAGGIVVSALLVRRRIADRPSALVKRKADPISSIATRRLISVVYCASRSLKRSCNSVISLRRAPSWLWRSYTSFRCWLVSEILPFHHVEGLLQLFELFLDRRSSASSPSGFSVSVASSS